MTLFPATTKKIVVPYVESVAILLWIGRKRSNELFGKYVSETAPYTTDQLNHIVDLFRYLTDCHSYI